MRSLPAEDDGERAQLDRRRIEVAHRLDAVDDVVGEAEIWNDIEGLAGGTRGELLEGRFVVVNFFRIMRSRSICA